MAKVTSDSVVANYNRKISLAFVALLYLCISVQAEANFTLSVNRRSTSDLYSLNSRTSIENCAASHLITEKWCALDEALFYGV